jgi:MFS-type transporter involved in bile tolerance (Atg22 family)
MGARQSLYPMVLAGVNAACGALLYGVLDTAFGLLLLAMAAVVVVVALYHTVVTPNADGPPRD